MRNLRLRSPWNIVASVIAIALLTAVSIRSAASDPPTYFPDGVLDDSTAKWLSSVFIALREPSLFESIGQAGTSYRFLKYPALSYPVSVRIEADASGTVVLTYAVGSFTNQGVPSELKTLEQREIGDAELAKVAARFKELNICGLPAADPADGEMADGEVWVFEYRSDSQYCVLERLSPGSDPFVSTAQYMLGLAGVY